MSEPEKAKHLEALLKGSQNRAVFRSTSTGAGTVSALFLEEKITQLFGYELTDIDQMMLFAVAGVLGYHLPRLFNN